MADWPQPLPAVLTHPASDSTVKGDTHDRGQRGKAMSVIRQITRQMSNPSRDRRHSDRVMIRIPIRVQAIGCNGTPLNEDGEALVVSRAGALLQTRSALPAGTTIVVTNALSRSAERFRVVWSAPETSGRYDVGVEQMADHENFWGVRFPPSPVRV